MGQFRAQLAEGESSDRSFGLLVGVALMVLGCLPLLKHGTVRPWVIAAGGVVVLVAVFAPRVLHKPKRAWLFLGFLIGLVVNPIVLGILFYLVVTPFGLLMRLFGRSPLILRPNPAADSYWKTRTEPASNMEEQF